MDCPVGAVAILDPDERTEEPQARKAEGRRDADLELLQEEAGPFPPRLPEKGRWPRRAWRREFGQESQEEIVMVKLLFRCGLRSND